MPAKPLQTEQIELSAYSLDIIADLVMTARKSAQQLGEEFLTYLLDMALIEIAQRGTSRSG